MDIKIVPAEGMGTEKTYPYVGITEDGAVIIFTAPETGTALKHESGKLHYATIWGEENFKPFHGTITITCP